MQIEDQQFTKWLRRPTEFIANAWYLLASAGQYLISYGVLMLVQLLSLFGYRVTDTAFTFVASTLAQILLFLLPVVIYAVTHDGVEQSMRLNMPRWDALLIALIAAPAGVMAGDKLTTWWMLLIERLGGTLYYSTGVPIPTTPPELAIELMLFALLPGICEELFFRGGLMGAWERRGTRQALVITSVLFALLHGSVIGLPIQLVMGFVLGYIVILSDSLAVGMIYHIAHNASILFLSYFSRDTASASEFLTLADFIRGTKGFPALIVQTVLWSAVYVGFLALFIRVQKKHGAQFDKIIEGDKEPMSWETLLVLLAGLLTVGVTFTADLMTVCGLG